MGAAKVVHINTFLLFATSMFGGRSGSASYGQGIAGFPQGSSIPMPSGGFNASVNNKSLDLVTNDVPSTLVFPGSHNAINMATQPMNRVSLNDFVFVLREQPQNPYIPTYRSRLAKFGNQETPIVTLQMVNSLLRSEAKNYFERNPTNNDAWKNDDGQWKPEVSNPYLITDKELWFQSPECVAEWCKPFGAALNDFPMSTLGGGGGSAPQRDRAAINVIVSRRANVKNIFFSIHHASTTYERWSAQSTNLVGVQYSVESVKVLAHADAIPVVMLSMVIIDDATQLGDPIDHAGNRDSRQRELSKGRDWSEKESICVSITEGEQTPAIPETSYEIFLQNPLGNCRHRVVVPIGRVLHSPPRSLTSHEALSSCHLKKKYDMLKPIEIELGCP